MPRKLRMFISGLPCHVIQRGNNRSVCFFEPDNYLFYLDCLAQACKRYHVDLHAYVLMTNHVHLLMTPMEESGISLVMQSVGRKYVQYVNKYLNRTGTLFEGRFKASLVQEDYYLLACMKYIELNPVRAKMVQSPQEYVWSSFRTNAGLKERKSLVAHSSYLALGRDYSATCSHYRELFKGAFDQSVQECIATAVNFNMPVGDIRFVQEIESALGRSIGNAKRGRPKILK